MNIVLNGVEVALKASDITGLLVEQGYEGKTIAVAVNGVFVPKARYGATVLRTGDAVEIVAPMQGG